MNRTHYLLTNLETHHVASGVWNSIYKQVDSRIIKQLKIQLASIDQRVIKRHVLAELKRSNT